MAIKDCFDKFGDKKLTEKFQKLVDGGTNPLVAARNVIIEESDALFERANKIRKAIGVPAKKQKQQKQIDETLFPPTQPIEGGGETSVDKPIEMAAKVAGVKAKNIRGLYDINRRMFGQDRVKSVFSAIVMDRMIGAMAKRAGVTKEQMYSRIQFQKADPSTLPQGVRMQVDAWHGSPYQFDKFTTEKIGTGEGAQAFGWGLYFTDLESIARNYADNLTTQKIDFKFKNDTDDNFLDIFTRRIGYVFESDRKFFIEAKLYFDKNLKGKNDTVISESGKEHLTPAGKFKKFFPKIEELDLKEFADYSLDSNNNVEFERKRYLYKVSLHKGKTPDQYTWLEWDKPMSDNALELFQKFNKEQGIKLSEPTEPIDKNDRMTAGQIYNWIADKIGQKQASLFLLENGIDGIKYPAESIARGATSDTARGFNYVVFDENAVSIEEVIKFQRDAEKARGAAMVNMDGTAIIYALTDPNVSTPLHELAHVFEHYLTDSERAAVMKAAGTKEWNTETSEYFARGFERYLAEGKSPVKELQRIFDKFKEWLTEIYEGITASGIDVKLNRPMRQIYAQMLGKEAPAPKDLTEAEKNNLISIANQVGVNFREVQNVYNKYGEGKPLDKITVGDYRKAQAERISSPKNQANFKAKKVTALQNMKDMFTQFFRGERKGAKEKAKLIENLNKSFSEYIKEQGFDDQKIKKVLKYFGTIKSVKQFNNAIIELDKMIENREYIDNVNEAVNLKKDLAKRIKSNTRTFGNYIQRAKEFSAINPKKILDNEQLIKYIETAKQLLEPKVPNVSVLDNVQSIFDTVYQNEDVASLEDNTLDTELKGETIKTKIADAFDKINDLKIESSNSLREFRRLFNYIQNKNTELSLIVDESGDAETLLDIQKNEEKLNEILKKAQADLGTFENEMFDNIEQQKSEYPLSEAISDYPAFKKLLTYFYMIPPSELSVVDKELYSQILNGLESGFINDQLYTLVRKHKTNIAANEVVNDVNEAVDGRESDLSLGQKILTYVAGKKRESFEKNAIQDITDYLLSKFASDVDRILGLKDTFWNKIWQPISRSFSQWQADMDNRLVELNKALAGFNEVNLRSIGIIMKQMDYHENMNDTIMGKLRQDAVNTFEQENGYPPSSDDLIEIEKKLSNYYLTMTEAIPVRLSGFDNLDLDKKAYEKIKGAINPDGTIDMDKLKSIDKKLHDAIGKLRIILDSLEQISEYNAITDGKEWKKRNSYFPSFTKRQILGQAEENFERLLRNGDITRFVSYTSGSNFSRVDDVFYINLNAKQQIESAIREATKQYHMKEPVNVGLGALRKSLGEKTIGFNNERRAVVQSLYEQTRKRISAQFVSQYFSGILEKAAGNLKLSWLASVGRPVVELTSATIKAMIVTKDITLPYNMARLIMQRAIPSQWSEMSNAISGKDGVHLGLMNEYTSAAEKVSKQALELQSASLQSTRLAKLAKRWISIAEAIISPAVFYKQFSTMFNQETGTEFNAKKYNTDESYRIYVGTIMERIAPKLEKTLEDAVVPQSKINSPVYSMYIALPFGKKIKIQKGTTWGSVYNMINPFTSVIAKERQLFQKGVYELFNGDEVNGIAKISAVWANAYIYSVMAQLSVAASSKGLGLAFEMIGQALGEDDDDEYQRFADVLEAYSDDKFADLFDLETQMYQLAGSFVAGAVGEFSYLLRPALAFAIGQYILRSDELKIDPVQKRRLVNAVNNSGITYIGGSQNYQSFMDYMKPMMGIYIAFPELAQQIARSYDLNEGKKDFLEKDKAAYVALSSLITMSQMLSPLPFSPDLQRGVKQYSKSLDINFNDKVIEDFSLLRATYMSSAIIEANRDYNRGFKKYNEIPNDILNNLYYYKKIEKLDSRFDKINETGILNVGYPARGNQSKKQFNERYARLHKNAYNATANAYMFMIAKKENILRILEMSEAKREQIFEELSNKLYLE